MVSESNLIFIISQPRSGSTMLQAILSNNDKVDTLSEYWLLFPWLSMYKPSLIQAEYDYNLSVEAFWDFIEKTGSRESYEQELKQFIFSQYSKIQTKQGNFVLDKTPRYYEIFDEMYNLFPKANFIILKRNPIGVLKSIMRTWNRYDFKALKKYHFRDIFLAPFMIQDIHEKYKDKHNCKVVKYEELLNNPSDTILKLYDWLELPYSEQVLDVTENKKFLGRFGDPIGIINNKKPVSLKDVESKHSLFKNKSLLNGYGHFLGKGFIQRYGYDFQKEYKPSFKFKLFKYYCYNHQLIKNVNPLNMLIKLFLEKVYKEKV